MPPPAFEDAPYTAHSSVDTPPSAPADLEHAAPAPTTSGTTNALLTAGDTESVNSSISPSARAIKACEPVSSAAYTACSVSRPKHNSPGGVLDDFSLADTIAATPCAHIPVSAPALPTASRRHTCPHLLVTCIWFWAIYLAWITTRCSGIAAYRSTSMHPVSCRLPSHQHSLNFYHFGSHRNGSMPPFSSQTAATLAHSEMPLLPVALVPAPPLLSTLKRFLLRHISVGHLH